MDTAPSRSDALASACHRYGPGRLPRADSYEVGAGYAAASGALAAAVVFAVANAVGHYAGVGGDLVHVFWAMCAVVAIPFVVPAAFLAGHVVWKHVSGRLPAFGVVGGVLTVALTYVVSLAGVYVALLIVEITTGTTGGSGEMLVDVALLTATIGIFAAILTAWFTIPLGVVGGSVYERASDRR